MELSSTVFIQVLIIFILMSVGFAMKKLKLITDDGIKQLTDILLMVVTPCVLVRAYQKDFSPELAQNLIIAAVMSFIIISLTIIIATIIFRKEDTLKYRVSIFGSVYSNCGFMAIPLLSAAMGSDGVFYGSAYLAVFTVLYWTHGICLYGGSLKEISVKRIISNPGLIGTTIAIILFVLRIKLPYVIGESIAYIADLNTPLAMLVMGSYLTSLNLKKALSNASIYLVTVMRLAAFPLVSHAILKIFGVDEGIGRSILISASCPTAAVAALLATKYRLDAVYAAEIVSITTILSILTIPLVLLLY
ncbi:MAG: AEC family transporter [Clostridiales bacterium]|nr:AEC family transporter [Clostridiales bacterium]